MKPPRFDYVAPTELSDAVSAVAGRAEKASVLAGGQSLMVQLHYRTQHPELVVDINDIRALDTITVEDGALRVGAIVRHRTFESPTVAPGALGRLMSRISPLIAHPPVRARGTMLGSLAYAHPQGEWCALAEALDAEIELTGPAGSRIVPAEEFFLEPYRTARRPDEILTSARVPLLPVPGVDADAVGVAFSEQHRTHLSFAQVAVLAVLALRNGVISAARLGVTGGRYRRPHETEAHLVGRVPEPAVFAEAGRLAAAAVDPLPEPNASAEYKSHAIGVLVQRVLMEAYEDSQDNERGKAS
jgi:carbon-monoxide dehydrogenase medium subunit